MLSIDKNVFKKPDSKQMGLTYEIAEKYQQNWSMTQIKREKDMHQEEVKRHIRKALKWFLDSFKQSSDVNGEEIVNTGEKG